jgi:hypothetical protein
MAVVFAVDVMVVPFVVASCFCRSLSSCFSRASSSSVFAAVAVIAGVTAFASEEVAEVGVADVDAFGRY